MGNPADILQVEAELALPFARTQIARFEVTEADEQVFQNGRVYRLDMCLTPRPDARARYRDHWAAHRRERIGPVYLLPPGETLVVACVPSVARSVVCELQADRLSEWLGEDIAWTDSQRQASLAVGSPRIRRLLGQLAEEMREPGFGQRAMVELLALQTAIELGRFFRGADEAAPGGLTPRRLRLIDERLAAGGATPTLSELAALCNMSVRQLIRAFRASRGCTLGDHIADLRVERAKLLLQGEASVKAIARELGFGAPSSFTYAFRRQTGLTPRDYRAALPGGVRRRGGISTV